MPTPGGLTGAPRRLLSLASVLRDKGIEICIATQSDSELFSAAEDLMLRTVAVEPVGVLRQRHGVLFGGNAIFRLKALFSLLVQNLGIAWKIRRHGADVVWVRGSKGIAYGALGAWLSRRPLVWDVGYELPSRGTVRWLHRLGLWAAKHVVFQYAAAPDEIFGPGLAARYRHKCQTIIPGIDLSALEPVRAERMVREGCVVDPFVILQVGTICDRKNQRVLVDAIKKVKEAEPEHSVEVWFAGGIFEEGYAEALQEETNTKGLAGAVSFLGWREDVHDLMAAADLLAMPSRDEGVPNTVQEAMAIGLPVAVSSVGGMPEIVSDGDTGWIMSIDNPEAWAKQIMWCLDNREQCSAMGQRASLYAKGHFGIDEWGEQYGSLIRASEKRNSSAVRNTGAS